MYKRLKLSCDSRFNYGSAILENELQPGFRNRVIVRIVKFISSEFGKLLKADFTDKSVPPLEFVHLRVVTVGDRVFLKQAFSILYPRIALLARFENVNGYKIGITPEQ